MRIMILFVYRELLIHIVILNHFLMRMRIKFLKLKKIVKKFKLMILHRINSLIKLIFKCIIHRLQKIKQIIKALIKSIVKKGINLKKNNLKI